MAIRAERSESVIDLYDAIRQTINESDCTFGEVIRVLRDLQHRYMVESRNTKVKRGPRSVSSDQPGA